MAFAHYASAGPDEDEELQLVGGEAPAPGPQWPRAGRVALGVCAACLAAGLALAAAGRGRVAEPPMTVRSLLEGAEFEEIITKNLVAMGQAGAGAADEEGVRARVAGAMQAVHATLHTSLSEDHEKMGKVHVTPEQKDAAFRKLQRFGDPSMVRVTQAALAAAMDNANAGGDQETLEHRLSDRLKGRLADIERLRASGRDGVASEYVPSPQTEIDGRRLAAADGLDQDVCTHAQALLESMHDQIGDDVPAAPARMLSMFGSSSSSPGAKKPSFMTCLMKAAPSPTKASKCIADNFSAFCKLAMNMLKGKAP